MPAILYPLPKIVKKFKAIQFSGGTGAKLVKTAAFAPVSNGMGLVHAILSHEDGLSISIAACREMLPDPAFYAECVNASFRELQAATKKRAPAKRKSGARGKAKKTTA